MLIYDVEIKNAIPPKVGARIEGIRYCEDWEDYEGMGVAVVGIYDYPHDSYHVFGEAELSEVQRMFDGSESLVGYNSLKFDNGVLGAAGLTIPRERCYDIMREVHLQVNRRWKLDDIARANGGRGKNGDGAMAPVLWQQGAHLQVANYCLNDVRQTKLLLDKIIRAGAIYDPDKRIIRLPKPGSRLIPSTPGRF